MRKDARGGMRDDLVNEWTGAEKVRRPQGSSETLNLGMKQKNGTENMN